MLSEEKIRLMIRLSDYEQNKGKTDLARVKYYKMDYVRFEILKTLVSVTVAVGLIVLLISMYHMEYLIANALELDYANMAKYFLVIYVLLLLLFTCVTISVATVQYEASKGRVKEYYSWLQELIEYYEKEEKESLNRDIFKEETTL